MREITTRRTRGAKHFESEASEGTFSAHFGAALHYFDESTGRLEDEEQTFIDDGQGGFHAPASEAPASVIRRGNNYYIQISRRTNGKGIEVRLPHQPTVEGNRVSFTFDGIDFTYYNTPTRLKLEAKVSLRRGPKRYSFPVAKIGTGDDFSVNSGGDLVSDEILIRRAFAIGSDGNVYPASEWSLQGGIASFEFDDTGVPLPYVLDPSPETFNVSASANDQFVARDGATYPPTGTIFRLTDYPYDVPWRGFDAGNYRIGVSLLTWDTSSIPDQAVVTSATLRAYLPFINNADSRNMTADWYVADGTSQDYSETALTTALSGRAISSLAVASENDVVLGGAAASVNKSGITGLRLHVDGGQPSAPNAVFWASFDDATNPEPRLILTYSQETMRPSSVSGLTNLSGAATDIDEDPDSTITDPGLVGTNPTQSGLTNGPEYPDARAQATGQTAFAWNTPTNVTDTSDTTLAIQATATTTVADYFTIPAAAFSDLPAGAVPTQISATIKHRAGTANRVTPWLQLGTANGTLIGSEINPQTNSTTGATLAATAGGITQSATAFGALPTRAQLVSGTFGVRLRIVRPTTSTYELYSIKLTVTYTDNATINTQADVALGNPVGTLVTGAQTGEIRARIRKKGTGQDPQGRIELRNASGSWSQTVIANTTITESDADGQLVSGTFDQSIITDKTDVVARFVGTGGAGGLSELVAIEWNATIAAPAPTVGASRALSYSVSSLATDTNQILYSTYSLVSPGSRALSYNISTLAAAAPPRQSIYNVFSRAQGTRDTLYSVSSRASQSRQVRFDVSGLTTALGRQLRFDLYTLALGSTQLRFDLAGLASKQAQMLYDVAAQILLTSKQASVLYNVASLATKQGQLRLDLYSRAAQSLSLLYTARTLAGEDRDLLYSVLSLASKTSGVRYDVLRLVGNNRNVLYDLRGVASKPGQLFYLVGGLSSQARQVRFDIHTRAGAQRALSYALAGLSGTSGAILYDVASLALVASRSAQLLYAVRAHAGKSQALPYDVFGRTGANLSVLYDLYTRAGASRDVRYALLALADMAGAQRIMRYDARALISRPREIRYDLYGLLTRGQALRFEINALVESERAIFYDIVSLATKQGIIVYRVEQLGADIMVVLSGDVLSGVDLLSEVHPALQAEGEIVAGAELETALHPAATLAEEAKILIPTVLEGDVIPDPAVAREQELVQ